MCSGVHTWCRLGSAVRRFVFSNCAAALPEYALLATVIIAVAGITVGLVNDQTEGTFRRRDDSGGTQPGPAAELVERPADDRANGLRWQLILVLAGIPLLAICAWPVLRRKPTNVVSQGRSLDAEPATVSKTVFDKRQRILMILSDDVNLILDGSLEVRHIMTRNPITVGPDQTTQYASELMAANNITHLLVCNADGSLVGLLSKHYLQRTNAKGISDAMAVDPLFVAPNSLLNPTVTQMINLGVSCIAVIEQGRAVGLLTSTDVLLTLQCAMHLLSTQRTVVN